MKNKNREKTTHSIVWVIQPIVVQCKSLYPPCFQSPGCPLFCSNSKKKNKNLEASASISNAQTPFKTHFKNITKEETSLIEE